MQAEDIIRRYKIFKVEVAAIESEMDKLKSDLWPLVEDVDGKLETPSGKASIVPAYKRIGFDTDKLKVMMELPEYSFLKQYAKESEVKASLRIT